MCEKKNGTKKLKLKKLQNYKSQNLNSKKKMTCKKINNCKNYTFKKPYNVACKKRKTLVQNCKCEKKSL